MIERRNGKERRGAKPVFTTAPRIVQATVGLRATFTPGAVTGAAVISHRWAVAGRAVGVVNGDFTPTAATVGKALTLRQTAQNQWGSITATSAPVSIGPAVASPPPAPPPPPPPASGLSYGQAGRLMANIAHATEYDWTVWGANRIDVGARGYSGPGGHYVDVELTYDGHPKWGAPLTISAMGAMRGTWSMRFAANLPGDVSVAHGALLRNVARATDGLFYGQLDCTGDAIALNVNIGVSQLALMAPGAVFGNVVREESADFAAEVNGIRHMNASDPENTAILPGDYRLRRVGGLATAHWLPDWASVNRTAEQAGNFQPRLLQTVGDEVVLRVTGQCIDIGVNLVYPPDHAMAGKDLQGADRPDDIVVIAGPEFARITANPHELKDGRSARWWLHRDVQHDSDRRTYLDRKACQYKAAGTMGYPDEFQCAISNAAFARNTLHNRAGFVLPLALSPVAIRLRLARYLSLLAPGIRLIFAMGNEAWWNSNYKTQFWLCRSAMKEVLAGGSDLNFDNLPLDQDWVSLTFGARKNARIHFELWQAAVEVFGADNVGPGKRVEIRLDGWNGVTGLLEDQLRYLTATRGPAAQFIHRGATSVYCWPHDAAGNRLSKNSTAAELTAGLYRDQPHRVELFKATRDAFYRHGIKAVDVYEAGMDIQYIDFAPTETAQIAALSAWQRSAEVMHWQRDFVLDLWSAGADIVTVFSLGTTPPLEQLPPYQWGSYAGFILRDGADLSVTPTPSKLAGVWLARDTVQQPKGA